MSKFERQVADVFKPSPESVVAAHDAMLVAQVETGGDELSLVQVLRAAYAVDSRRVAAAIEAAIRSIDSGYYWRYLRDLSTEPALVALKGHEAA